MRRIAAMVLASVALAAGALVAPAARSADALQSNVVVSLLDSGINPYHLEFRDDSPRAFQHPSTYLPGFPEDTPALHLTFGADYMESVAVDCERVWLTIEPGRLYWIPGTRIVGAIAFATEGTTAADGICEGGEPAETLILDANGHGTMTASRAAGRTVGMCPQCLIVSAQAPLLIQPGPAAEVDGLRWMAANASWIDVESHSWGPLPGFVPTDASGIGIANPEFMRAVEEGASRHPSFWASGNGIAGQGGLVGDPTPTRLHFTPSALIVGGHDSGQVTTWPGFTPHVIADACDSPAARAFSVDEVGEDVGGGTSGATPFAAGAAARVLLEARQALADGRTGVHDAVAAAGTPTVSGPLADGRFTLDEWRAVTLRSASARPNGYPSDGPPCASASRHGPTPLRWTDVPPGVPEYVAIGYGALDPAAVDLARRVVRGEVEEPDRTATDEYFARDRAVRQALYDAATTGG